MKSWKAPAPSCKLRARLTPRSEQNLLEWDGERLKIKTTAPPADGAANAAAARAIAEVLGIAPSRVQLVSGFQSRDKLFQVEGLELEKAVARLIGGETSS